MVPPSSGTVGTTWAHPLETAVYDEISADYVRQVPLGLRRSRREHKQASLFRSSNWSVEDPERKRVQGAPLS